MAFEALIRVPHLDFYVVGLEPSNTSNLPLSKQALCFMDGISQTELCLLCYRWYKFIDGSARKQPVVLNDRVKQVSGTLIIKEAKVDDSGKYLCVVNNSVGGEYRIFIIYMS